MPHIVKRDPTRNYPRSVSPGDIQPLGPGQYARGVRATDPIGPRGRFAGKLDTRRIDVAGFDREHPPTAPMRPLTAMHACSGPSAAGFSGGTGERGWISHFSELLPLK